MHRSLLLLALAGLLAAAGVSPASADWRSDAFGWSEPSRLGMGRRAESPRASRRDRSNEVRVASLGDDVLAPSRRASTRSRTSYRKSGRRVHASSGGRSGIASYYWQPQRLASGGRFNPNALTAAHRSLPFGTRVRVTHLGNGRSVTVTINDRGPFVRGRIIDLSRAAAGAIGMRGAGLANVRLDVVGR